MADAELKRLRWRCRRGARELDLVLLRYLEQHYAGASLEAQAAFHILLEQQDPDLLDWINGRSRPAEGPIRDLVDLLRQMPVSGPPPA